MVLGRTAAALVIVTLLASCGGSGSSGIEKSLQTYLDDMGPVYTVQSCTDQSFSKDGKDLWECQVKIKGKEPATWNVAVKNGTVVDASPK
jgi:hypothetical protein